jgi:hybrid cluster-associated redox disulfide protein
MSLSAETIVNDLLQEHPNCARPFLNNKMLCVGCPVARFHDIAYACEKHGVDLTTFVAQLKGVAK